MSAEQSLTLTLALTLLYVCVCVCVVFPGAVQPHLESDGGEKPQTHLVM